MIDTHTHLHDPSYLQTETPKYLKKGEVAPAPQPTPDGNADAVRRAIGAGLEMMILPGASLDDIAPMKRLAAQFPDHLRMAIGVHPTELTDNPSAAVDIVERELTDHPGLYVAVGEIGLDYYWKPYDRDAQMEAFRRQCLLALDHDLPIIIHCREALDDTLDVLRSLPEVPRGVFHSFGGTREDVDAIRRVGDFYFGINGIVTFKNSNLRDTLPHIDFARLLLETDSPYLAPAPLRGRRNESSYLPAILHTVADTLRLSPSDVDHITTANARRLFHLPRQ